MDRSTCALLLAVALGAAPATGQSLYKCVDAGKTSYSDKPCQNGTQRTLSPDGGPSAEDRAAAQARFAREQAEQNARDRMRSARQEAQDESEALARQQAGSFQPAPDPRANERVMVHGSRGWDYKTRGQIEAERAARDGRPITATGAAWETERVTTHGSKGWESTTRLGAAQAEGARQRRSDERAREAASAVPNPSMPGTMIDQLGKTWNRTGGFAQDPSTGKMCPVSGNVINC